MKPPTGHGKELARFIKPGQILHILEDGCIFTELFHIARADGKGHTAGMGEGSIDEAALEVMRQLMIDSGYKEEDEMFWL